MFSDFMLQLSIMPFCNAGSPQESSLTVPTACLRRNTFQILQYPPPPSNLLSVATPLSILEQYILKAKPYNLKLASGISVVHIWQGTGLDPGPRDHSCGQWMQFSGSRSTRRVHVPRESTEGTKNGDPIENTKVYSFLSGYQVKRGSKKGGQRLLQYFEKLSLR